MNVSALKKQRVISKFQDLLRCGKDYNVRSMYEEAGKTVCIQGVSARRIINSHYRKIINDDMIGFVGSFSCSPSKNIDQFSERFQICKRESRLLIRYIKCMK